VDDAESFAKAVAVEDGLGVAWPIQTKWGRLDVSSPAAELAAKGSFEKFLVRPGLAEAGIEISAR